MLIFHLGPPQRSLREEHMEEDEEMETKAEENRQISSGKHALMT
jgi:hypothetical protein